MSCVDCIHLEACVEDETFSNTRCQLFRNKKMGSVSIDWDAYIGLIKSVQYAKNHLMKIRKSRNRDSVKFHLDCLERSLKGEQQ